MTRSTLPIHPHTGLPLEPVGFRKDGRPIFPILGASEDDGADGGTEGTEGAEGADGTEGAEGTEGDPPQEGEDDGDEGMSPEDYKRELSRVRAEAAQRRVQLREAQEALKKAKTPEEFEAAVNELTTKNTELETQLLRERVARKHSLPDDLAEVLKGSTEEELVTHAKKLAKYAPADEPEDREPRGGLEPDSGGVADKEAMLKAARSRRY